MADLNPTGRFSSPEIVPLLEPECGLKSTSTVADIGSGTGLLSKLFLDFGCRVIGIEPSREMREAGDQFPGAISKVRRHGGSIGAYRARRFERGFCCRGASLLLVRRGCGTERIPPDSAVSEMVTLIWNEREVTGGSFSLPHQHVLRKALEIARVTLLTDE